MSLFKITNFEWYFRVLHSDYNESLVYVMTPTHMGPIWNFLLSDYNGSLVYVMTQTHMGPIWNFLLNNSERMTLGFSKHVQSRRILIWIRRGKRKSSLKRVRKKLLWLTVVFVYNGLKTKLEPDGSLKRVRKKLLWFPFSFSLSLPLKQR